MVVLFGKYLLTIEHGRQPKYDLKSPVILLRDEAKTSSLKEGREPSHVPAPGTVRRSSTYSDKPIESSQEEFMSFLDNLLGSLGQAPMSASDPFFHLDVPRMPSPTPTNDRFKTVSCREAIDLVQKGLGLGTKAKVGVFEIGKNGITVATLTLPKTTFKLGDTIDGVLDLEDGIIKCYQVSCHEEIG
jgi:hypothetical protein